MFNFLKKKLKIFEQKLEEEIETELQSELQKEQRSEAPVKESPPSAVISSDISEKADTAQAQPVQPQVISRKRAEKVQQRTTPGGDDSKKKLDRQIEESIERELQQIVDTRKRIEQEVPADQKTAKVIDDAKLDDLLWELEIGLLESDVAYSVIQSIKNDIKKEFSTVPFYKVKTSDFIETILKNAILHVLKRSEFDFLEYIKKQKKKPVVIMFVGVNGTGKTLAIAKIATLLKKHGITCVLAAGDTFRAGAIEQLSIHAENIGVKIVKHGPGSDPAAVAFDAIEHAKAKHRDVVLLDTAGRMQTNSNLMDEMAKIKRVAKPDLIIFVGDALSGNDAVEQAKRFHEVVGIDGVILNKVDADAKGGSSLSIAYTLGKPLLFVGVGQGYEDQRPFDPEWMIQNLFEK
ncbi:MAG: signal recognition particle-docking protein FtsY [Candidatus Thermoplasmatota archaeon]